MQDEQIFTTAPPALAAGPALVTNSQLQLLSGDVSSTHAVILVAGIHDDHSYFADWVGPLSSSDNRVMGWTADHRAQTMQESALALAQSLAELKENGVTDITILAHSMGGLVAKGAVDELSRNGDAAGFNTVDLHAMGTPWGGFAMADIVRYLPGSDAISHAIGYPMGPEMGPTSPYLSSLAQPMPTNGELHIYRGTADDVATPEATRTKERYDSIEGLATSVTELQDYGHSDYAKMPLELLSPYLERPLPGIEILVMEPGQQIPVPATAEAPQEMPEPAAMSM